MQNPESIEVQREKLAKAEHIQELKKMKQLIHTTDPVSGKPMTLGATYHPSMTFQTAYEFTVKALEWNDPEMIKLAEELLMSRNSEAWVIGQLAKVGIFTDQSDYHHTWIGLRYKDLYRRLPDSIKRRWRKSSKLCDMLYL
jgi:hypothetical protein